MTVPNNLLQPIYNRASLGPGTYYVHAPNDFTDYDELWAHIIVTKTNGSPTSGSLKMNWQLSHPLSGGLYHDTNPTWNDLDYKQNSHLLHSGLDFPAKVVKTVFTTFSPSHEYVRGIRLGTGRVRLKFDIAFEGGTTPSYVVSLAIYARRNSPDIQPTPQAKYLTALNTNYDYIRDVWGYSVRNKDAAIGKFILRNGSSTADPLISEHIPAEGSLTKTFDRPVRFSAGMFPHIIAGGANGLDITLYTTDNLV